MGENLWDKLLVGDVDEFGLGGHPFLLEGIVGGVEEFHAFLALLDFKELLGGGRVPGSRGEVLADSDGTATQVGFVRNGRALFGRLLSVRLASLLGGGFELSDLLLRLLQLLLLEELSLGDSLLKPHLLLLVQQPLRGGARVGGALLRLQAGLLWQQLAGNVLEEPVLFSFSLKLLLLLLYPQQAVVYLQFLYVGVVVVLQFLFALRAVTVQAPLLLLLLYLHLVQLEPHVRPLNRLQTFLAHVHVLYLRVQEKLIVVLLRGQA